MLWINRNSWQDIRGWSQHIYLIPPSIRVFSSESAFCIRRPKYWSFSINSSNEYWELISFRIDWFDLFAVQGTLKSLRHHISKASVLCHSAFFLVPRSHLYTATGTTIALTMWTFAGKIYTCVYIKKIRNCSRVLSSVFVVIICVCHFYSYNLCFLNCTWWADIRKMILNSMRIMTWKILHVWENVAC